MTKEIIRKNSLSLVVNNEIRAQIPSVEDTRDFVKEIHQDQTDQNDQPYYAHPFRVAQNIVLLDPNADEDTIKAALLHDAIEDCGITEDDLKKRGYSDQCVNIVSLVSRPENDRRPYTQVIDELIKSEDKGAMIVKLSDSLDNLNPKRIDAIRAENPAKAERLERKYSGAVEKLCEALNIDSELCKTVMERDIDMDENFNGEKYYLFDGSPIKTIWEDGIITEVYSKDSQTSQLSRNDGLAYYVETEVSSKDEITKDEFVKLVEGRGKGLHPV